MELLYDIIKEEFIEKIKKKEKELNKADLEKRPYFIIKKEILELRNGLRMVEQGLKKIDNQILI